MDNADEPPNVKADAEARAFSAFQAVLDNARNIQYDHYLLYFTRE